MNGCVCVCECIHKASLSASHFLTHISPFTSVLPPPGHAARTIPDQSRQRHECNPNSRRRGAGGRRRITPSPRLIIQNASKWSIQWLKFQTHSHTHDNCSNNNNEKTRRRRRRGRLIEESQISNTINKPTRSSGTQARPFLLPTPFNRQLPKVADLFMSRLFLADTRTQPASRYICIL